MKKCMGIVSLLAVLSLCFYSVGMAGTYDIAADFSAETNPNGAWSYGWSESRGSAFNIDTEPAHDYSWGNYVGWLAPNYAAAPINIGYAVTDINHPTVNIPAGTVSFHPGPSGQNSVIRWTAPASGTYKIMGWFTGNDFAYPTTTDVAVLHGTTEIFSGAINSYRVPLNFSLTERVNAGETIDFTVGFGTGGYAGDTTGINATIQELVVDVTVDVKPGSDPNCVNVNNKGVIPVAILGSASFNVRDVNPETVFLENMPVKISKGTSLPMAHYEDVNSDGIEDLVLQIKDNGALSKEITRATLTGNLYNSTPIKGTDSICIVP